MLNDIDNTCPTIILGDFNMKSLTGKQEKYNDKLEQEMLRQYNLKQIIKEDTSNFSSVIDLCFTNAQAESTIIWNFWSDHKIISVGLKV